MNFSKILSIFLLFTLISCAQQRVDTCGGDPSCAKFPEILSRNEFPAKVFQSEVDLDLSQLPNKSQFDGREYKIGFYSAVMKVTFVNSDDGVTYFARAHEPIYDTTVYDPMCTNRPTNVGDVVPFRKKAEFYLRLQGKNKNRYSVTLNGKNLAVTHENGCPSLSTKERLVLDRYPEDGSKIVVSGSDGTRQSFVIPKDFTPFVLVRYYAGEIMPVPMRLDTLTISPEENKIIAVYRSTINSIHPTRKIEFRNLLADDQITAGGRETRVQALSRTRKTRAYLRKCRVPSFLPGEPCAKPDPIGWAVMTS